MMECVGACMCMCFCAWLLLLPQSWLSWSGCCRLLDDSARMVAIVPSTNPAVVIVVLVWRGFRVVAALLFSSLSTSLFPPELF